MERPCARCGAMTEMKTGNQKYCAACAIEVHHERSIAYAKAHKPPSSMMSCEKCGKKIVRRSGTQRYCKACRKLVDREQQRAWANHARGLYEKKEGDEMLFRKKLPPQSAASKIARAARDAGMSYGKFVAAEFERRGQA